MELSRMGELVSQPLAACRCPFPGWACLHRGQASKSCMRGSEMGGKASKSTAQQQGGGAALRGHSFDRLPWVVVAPVPPSLKPHMSKTVEKMLKVAEGDPQPRN